jgi:molecular chaperone GrpE
MAGIHESGHDAATWESGAGAAPGSPGAPAAGPDDGFDDAAVSDAASDDDVVDAEVIDDDVDGGIATEIIDGTAPELDAVAIARGERDEYLDALRRLQAEFENYRKRVAKQQTDQTARAALSLVEKLLPVLDTLDLATEHLGDADSADGRALVAASSQLRDVLAKEGLERIDPMGEPFDPNAHEAVGHVPAEEPTDHGAESGAAAGETGAPGASSGDPVVGQVMRPGYRWRGAVVRPAMVMVRD